MTKVKGYSKEKMDKQLKLIFKDIQSLATAALDIEDSLLDESKEEMLVTFGTTVDTLVDTLTNTKYIIGGTSH
jgi:hypothetical protein|tara:strand:+ start:478 stop:696 length:219 start_codon:yes stop_codon:yes gene_type:complete